MGLKKKGNVAVSPNEWYNSQYTSPQNNISYKVNNISYKVNNISYKVNNISSLYRNVTCTQILAK